MRPKIRNIVLKKREEVANTIYTEMAAVEFARLFARKTDEYFFRFYNVYLTTLYVWPFSLQSPAEHISFSLPWFTGS